MQERKTPKSIKSEICPATSSSILSCRSVAVSGGAELKESNTGSVPTVQNQRGWESRGVGAKKRRNADVKTGKSWKHLHFANEFPVSK